MKKILLFLIAVFSLTACAAYADSEFNNASLEINCINGEIVVSGSFDSTDSSRDYCRVMLASYSEEGRLTSLKKSDKYDITDGTNDVSFTADITDDVQISKAFLWADDIIPICTAHEKTIRSLKVLAIGNSFSVDAMEWLYNIADNCGIDNIVLGNVYRGGCSLQEHALYSENNAKAYHYYKNTTGTWTDRPESTLNYCLTDEDWNLITLQQASENSGIPDTYEPYLTELIDYINNNKTNPNARLAWHMTWAYPQDSTHGAFPKYNRDQITMYNAIVSTLKEKILTKDEIEFYIPVGTAIQNVRTSFIGDTLNRDNCHLDLYLGRYIAGLTWFYKITGLLIDDISWVPDAELISSDRLEVVKECVKNAVAYPDEITQSQYTEEPGEGYDLSKYEQLDWEPVGSSFYNSIEGSIRNTSENSTASNLKYYISSKIFTKDELPNGTLIVVDSGYQYRPEGWTQLDEKNASSARPNNVTTNVIEVSDIWWGEFNYRAFNVSVVGSSTDISDRVEEIADHLRIYVPKAQ